MSEPAENEMLERLKLRLGIEDNAQDELLYELLCDAADFIKAYIRRAEVPEGCKSAQVRLALTLYNKMGLDGEAGHSEGGVSITFDGNDEIKDMLRPFRLLKG